MGNHLISLISFDFCCCQARKAGISLIFSRNATLSLRIAKPLHQCRGFAIRKDQNCLKLFGHQDLLNKENFFLLKSQKKDKSFSMK